MKLTRNKLFSGFLSFGLITILWVLFDVQYFYLRAIFSFIFLTTIPGLLIMLMLKIRKIGFWEYLVYTIGLSIAFLMFAGLAVNWALPFLHITDKPLSLSPLFTSFDIILSIFGVIAYRRNKKISLQMHLPKLNRLNKVFFTLPMIFPILSILGATTLNNGGPNYLTMIMLGGIAVYVLLIALFRNKLNEHVFPWVIYSISLSFLLMFSLRSWNILGWDINQEFYVFQITKSHMLWDINNFHNAYNACLSITILPTIFSTFLSTNDQYIYKLLFQIIFSFMSLITFQIFMKYVNKITAFLASFFFISQIVYYQVAPTLNRQEIALLFFALIVITILNKEISKVHQGLLFLIFGFSMIVSHYSTTYVTFGILTFMYVANILIGFINKIKLTNIKNRSRINIKNLILLFLFGFIWYMQITGIGGGFFSTINKSFTELKSLFKIEAISPEVQSALFNNARNIPYTDLLENQIISSTKIYSSTLKIQPIFTQTNKQYQPTYLPDNPGESNSILEAIFSNAYTVQAYLIKILFLFGIVAAFIIKRKSAIFDAEFLLLSAASLMGVVLIVAIPFISLSYDLNRIYLQALIALSLIGVWGFTYFLKMFKFNIKIINVLTFSFFIIFYLYQTNFLVQLTGVRPVVQNVHLSNSGEYYDWNYTHTSEIASARWLGNHYGKQYFVYADAFASLRLIAFADINYSLPDLFPSTIDKNAYIYGSYTNTIKDKAFISYTLKNWTGTLVSYNFPTKFLSDNKNKIYSNGESVIYK